MSDRTRTYRDVKLSQLNELSTYRFHGTELEFDKGSAARSRWRLVAPCLCVQDSPENPCPCPPRLFWFRGDMVVAEGDAGRKDHDGNELRYFDVLVDATIVVETMRPVSAGALKRLGADTSDRAIIDLTADS